MTRLSENWYLDNRQILHFCAPGVRVRWTGGRACECGILTPRRIRRFYEWMYGAPSVARGLTLIVIAPTRSRPSARVLHRSKS